MKKLLKRVVACLFLTSFVFAVMLLTDREQLNETLIRLHVMANSDSEKDQAVKLQVRDAVLAEIQEDLRQIADTETAKRYLQENLPKIEAIANETLQTIGYDGKAVVSLCKETFDTRHYDTFSLPAGVYEALRITIGEGQGKNWWCVAFPTLCIPATSAGFADAAVSAGFSEGLSDTLTGEEGYEVRFFLLDALGRLENIFFEE